MSDNTDVHLEMDNIAQICADTGELSEQEGLRTAPEESTNLHKIAQYCPRWHKMHKKINDIGKLREKTRRLSNKSNNIKQYCKPIAKATAGSLNVNQNDTKKSKEWAKRLRYRRHRIGSPWTQIAHTLTDTGKLGEKDG